MRSALSVLGRMATRVSMRPAATRMAVAPVICMGNMAQHRRYSASERTMHEATAVDADSELDSTDALLDSSGYTARESAPSTASGSHGELEQPRWMLLGAPGAGKGTYAKILSTAFGGVPIVGMGDMLRDVIASGSEKGKQLAVR